MQVGHFTNPWFLPRHEIDLQSKANGQVGVIQSSLFHFAGVFGQFIGAHSPFIKIIFAHGGMVAETNLRHTRFNSARGILGRLAFGVAAEGRVHVVIGRQRHACSIASSGRGGKGFD